MTEQELKQIERDSIAYLKENIEDFPLIMKALADMHKNEPKSLNFALTIVRKKIK